MTTPYLPTTYDVLCLASAPRCVSLPHNTDYGTTGERCPSSRIQRRICALACIQSSAQVASACRELCTRAASRPRSACGGAKLGRSRHRGGAGCPTSPPPYLDGFTNALPIYPRPHWLCAPSALRPALCPQPRLQSANSIQRGDARLPASRRGLRASRDAALKRDGRLVSDRPKQRAAQCLPTLTRAARDV